MNTGPRKPWIAAVLAVVCNGLGHLYAGSVAAAILVFALGLAAGVAASAALRAGPIATAAAALGVFAVWTGQATHAAITAGRRASAPRTRASHPVALVGFYAATVVVTSVVLPWVRTHVGHTVYAPAGSMIPTVQTGDYLAVAGGRPTPLRGAVVIVAAPPGAPTANALLKRIVAVGGDTVELRDGALVVNGVPVPRRRLEDPCTYSVRPDGAGWREEPCVAFEERLDDRAYRTFCTPALPCGDVEPQVVPAGHVWVAGDHRDHSADSRVFGPISDSSILGEARWVIASWGPGGLRWDRFGERIR